MSSERHGHTIYNSAELLTISSRFSPATDTLQVYGRVSVIFDGGMTLLSRKEFTEGTTEESEKAMSEWIGVQIVKARKALTEAFKG